MEPETKLDEEYKICLKFLRPYIINTTNPNYVSHCRVWIEKMSACSANQKDVRNKYMNELCRQMQNGKLEEPFTLPPPPFGNNTTLVPYIPQVADYISYTNKYSLNFERTNNSTLCFIYELNI